MEPPTILYNPKSDAPSASKTRRVVYKDTNTDTPILKYRYPVFFITLEDVDT